MKSLGHTNIMEKAIHIWRKGLSFNNMFSHVFYDAPEDVKSAHSGLTNQTFNFPRLPQDERVFRAGFGVPGSEIWFRPGQKNRLRMKHTIRKFTLPGNLFVARYADTFSKAKARVHLPQNGQFFGCAQASESVTSSPPLFVLFFAWHASNKESGITGDDDLRQAAFPFIKRMEKPDM